MDYYNNLIGGSSSTDFVKHKIELIAKCEGLSCELEKNIENHCKNISQACIAVLALVIRPEDMDAVTCLYCGSCPKVVNRNGLYIVINCFS